MKLKLKIKDLEIAKVRLLNYKELKKRFRYDNLYIIEVIQ